MGNMVGKHGKSVPSWYLLFVPILPILMFDSHLQKYINITQYIDPSYDDEKVKE